MNSVILTTEAVKRAETAGLLTMPEGLRNRNALKKMCSLPAALHIVVSLSNLLENFPLALGSFPNKNVIF